MNRFTSHIDFKLTKKRLVLLNKNRSLAGRIIRLLPLLPMFLFITFIFCSKPDNPNELYSNVRLQLISSPYEQVQDSGIFYDSRMYDMDGVLFSGVQSHYFKSDDKLLTSVTFKEGLRVKEQTFKRTGEEWYRTEIEYDFEKKKRIAFRGYDLGVLTSELIDSSPDHDGKQLYREWHPNGQLKFQSTSDEKGTQGLMTLYNNSGNVVEQERYEDGELIEKIK